MQHDVFVQPIVQLRRPYPFIAVLQSDYSVGMDRLCAPLIPLRLSVPSRGSPLVAVGAEMFLLLLGQMTALPTRLLRRHIGSIASSRDDIIRAIDWLFTGI